MAIFLVTASRHRHSHSNVWVFPFECSDNLETLSRRFNRGDCVVGNKIIYRPNGKKIRLVVAREPISISGADVRVIERDDSTYVEDEADIGLRVVTPLPARAHRTQMRLARRGGET